jgi:hypothetical protein
MREVYNRLLANVIKGNGFAGYEGKFVEARPKQTLFPRFTR